MQVEPVAVPGHRVIGGVLVEPRTDVEMRPVDGRALALVDGHRVAVGDMAIGVQAEGDIAGGVAIEPNGERAAVDGFDGAEAAVVNPEAGIVAAEGQPVARGERHRVGCRRQDDILPESPVPPEAGPSAGVQSGDVAAQGGHDDLRPAGLRGTGLVNIDRAWMANDFKTERET